MVKRALLTLFIVTGVGMFSLSCLNNNIEKQSLSNINHPDWVKNAVIYEVNIRQFTPEGTFNAFAEHLPRLKDLGIDILWFMPIHPIGIKERKGELGSYYSVRDYKGINPEFGTIDNFKEVVEKAQSLGMKVIIDWVANHTSRDAVWIESNPEWYVIDSTTNTPLAPFDWSDVAKLDFTNNELREAMVEAMMYWVKDIKIDGFRCDVAAEVPVDFWEYAVKELRKENPQLFMLAEAEVPELQNNAFNMYYGWHFHHILNKISLGEYGVDSIRSYMNRGYTRFPSNTIPMFFTSNHDENSWNGTEFERMGNYAEQMAVFTFLMPGMPLIYNGQESGFNRRLHFFTKDSIDWDTNLYFTKFYKDLITFKKSNKAVNTPTESEFVEFKTESPDSLYAFGREGESNIVLAIFNFGRDSVKTKVDGVKEGNYSVLFGKEKIFIDNKTVITIPPYGYMVYSLIN